MGRSAATSMDAFWKEELRALKSLDLFRSLRVLNSRDGTRCVIGGRELVNFCSNDYLGLSCHPRVKEAAIEAIRAWGVGSGASRLVSGNLALYEELERKISAFKETEAALVFATGYGANLGTISALYRDRTLIFSDELNHASIVDACRLTRARVVIYPHCDMGFLESKLREIGPKEQAIIVTDGVFSMEGDLCPLPQLVRLSREFGALLVIDDAHATGVIGPNGKGSFDYWDIEDPGAVQIGTFSKAIGTMGGFVAGEKALMDYLINKARPLIYSTALPAPVLAATIASLNIIQEDSQRRHRLLRLGTMLRDGLIALGFSLPVLPTPIFPLVIGESKDARALSEHLFERGIFVPAIRPPSVPEGKSRIRISLSTLHTEEQIGHLLEAIREFSRFGAD